MIIYLSADGDVSLKHPENLTQLHCEIAVPPDAIEKVKPQLVGMVRIASQDTAWINSDWLSMSGRNTQGTQWLQAFSQMMEKAKPHGWISADGKEIKAHIVWLTI